MLSKAHRKISLDEVFGIAFDLPTALDERREAVSVPADVESRANAHGVVFLEAIDGSGCTVSVTSCLGELLIVGTNSKSKETGLLFLIVMPTGKPTMKSSEIVVVVPSLRVTMGNAMPTCAPTRGGPGSCALAPDGIINAMKNNAKTFGDETSLNR